MFTARNEEIILTVITLGCLIIILLHFRGIRLASKKRKEVIVAELLQELIYSHEADRGEKLAPWEVDLIEQFAIEQVEKDPEGMKQKAMWLSENRVA